MKEAHEDNLGVEIEGFEIERRLLNSSSKPTKKMMWSIGISRQESRRGAEVAKSWHESNRLILDQRDKAIEPLKESIETQAELSKQNEELTIRV